MPIIAFEDQEYDCGPAETVLDCLIRQGVSVNYSCRAGVCQTCMMVSTDGRPPAESQVGLKDTLKAQDHFLMCSCVPEQKMSLVRPGSDGVSYDATVSSLDRLNDDVVRLRLERPDGYEYQPGQFLNLKNDQGVARSYSLASIPSVDDFLELHVRHMPGGQVSGWVAERLSVGGNVTISAATGQCVYMPGRPEQSLLLVGTGTGLAPLLGIARDALQQGHVAPIHLYHGSGDARGLYLVDVLRAMAEAHAPFHYHPCASRGVPPEGVQPVRAADQALADFTSLAGWRVFLCGREDMVKAAQKKTFLAGASMQDIFADPFVETKLAEA
ncbi:MAG: 2Fe-2S iron-sulfur cluster binding domain-containing protein [Gammaproteobacteria bacterium]|nr:2Fe-2S iron-sulfur cluster binding domain-containing protein [Gammaproteobacteria bacterium]